MKDDGNTDRLGALPERWKSCAQWPDKLLAFSFEGHNNTTMDEHDTREQAEAVCQMLERDGLGGERIHFPVKTWVVAPVLPQ